MRRGSELACAIAAALAGCDRPAALVICHNANCAGSPDPAADDTLASLRASLALRWRDLPVFDGIEIDLVWLAGCRFAHDPEQAAADPIDAGTAIGEVAAHLAGTDQPGFGDRFVVHLELKPTGDPADHDDLAGCALALGRQLAAAAAARDHRLMVLFESSPALLRVLLDHPEWTGKHAGESIEYRLGAGFSAPRPLGAGTRPLAEFGPDLELDVVSFNPRWLTDGTYQAYRSLGLDLSIWMLSAVGENLAAIDRYEPAYVSTNDALLVRRWLER